MKARWSRAGSSHGPSGYFRVPVSAGSEPSAGGGPGGDTLFETSVLGLPLLVSALILPHLCPGDFIPLCLSFNPPPGRSVIVVLN